MTLLHQRLPTRIEQDSVGGPTVPGRTMTRFPSGKLNQGFNSSEAVHKFNLSHGIRRNADAQVILDVFYVILLTPYTGFLFRDWRDYLLTAANSRLTLISGSVYQINRVHTFGGIELLRPIYKPAAGVVITRTRSGTPSTATATVDTTTGQVTISGHMSGDTYTPAGQFDLPVTFSGSEWLAELKGQAGNLIVKCPRIDIEEVPPP